MGLFGNRGRQTGHGEPAEADFAPGELAAALRPLVMPPDRLPQAVADGAPTALHRLVMAVAVRVGDMVNLVPTARFADIGGRDIVWDRARSNVENLDGLRVDRSNVVPGRQDSMIVTISGTDPFVASRASVLDWLILEIYGSSAAHGVAVAIPVTTRLLLHRISGPGALKAVEGMTLLAESWYRDPGTAQPIDPDVYYVSPDRLCQRIGYHRESKAVIDTSRLFGQALGRVLAQS